MNKYFKVIIIPILSSLLFSQWWFPEMEIIPVNPTLDDNISIRIFGDTPSNVVFSITEVEILESSYLGVGATWMGFEWENQFH